MPRALLGVGALSLIITAGCKRDADAPLPRSVLFPEQSSADDEDLKNPFGALPRAVAVAEKEPNDGPEQAQPLADGSYIAGKLGPPGDVPGATDWFELDRTVSPGRVLRVTLADAPKCARLALVDVDGTALQSATAAKGPAVLSHLRGGSQVRRLKVWCTPAKGKARQPTGGAYKLSLTSRPTRRNEEQEPNDERAHGPKLLPIGAAQQGALARHSDRDMWLLPKAAEQGPAALRLSVTGLPGARVQLQVQSADGTVVLKRRSGRGKPIMVGNFHLGALGDGAVVVLSSISGASVTHSYSLFLAAIEGPAKKQRDEREPNDRRQLATVATLDQPLSGTLDGAGDVDWWTIQTIPGTALGVFLKLPETVKARLVVHPGDSKPVWTTSSSPGGTLKIERVAALAERVHIRVHGVGDSHDISQPYRLEITDMSALDAALDLSNMATADLAPSPSPTAL